MEDFIAVLVLYKSALNQSQTFLSICRSLKKNNLRLDLIVYDNTPGYNADLIAGLNVVNNINIDYRQDNDNSGVSKAYNLAQSVGKAKSKKWIILLDQDTDFPENTVAEYIRSTSLYPDDKLFAPMMLVNQNTIISPCHFKFMRGFSVKHVNPGVNSLNKYSVINCGMCISISAFEKNKGYNELIKLDFSDHDFIKRFKKYIGERFIVLDLRVYHELSSSARNSKNSDLVRFDYYLKGARYISSSFIESFFLTINATIRAVKLSLIHRSFGFLIQLFK
jgi:GT2 family glycosyltransferase